MPSLSGKAGCGERLGSVDNRSKSQHHQGQARAKSAADQMHLMTECSAHMLRVTQYLGLVVVNIRNGHNGSMMD